MELRESGALVCEEGRGRKGEERKSAELESPGFSLSRLRRRNLKAGATAGQVRGGRFARVILISNSFLEGVFPMAHAPQFLKLVNEAKKKIKETNVADVKRRSDEGEKFLLVDVREDNEWAKGHLPGAGHMGRGVIERDIEQRIPHTNAKLVLYCGGGLPPSLVAENLPKMGYNNVESMDGGL